MWLCQMERDCFGNPSSSQSSLILKQPGSNALFYIFTVDANETLGANGFCYSIVDMSLDGHKGDVTAKSVRIRANVREKLTAAKHRNGTDFWILTNDWDDDAIFCYRVSCAGLDTAVVRNYIGPIHGHLSYLTLGCMKVSPQNDKIAMATWYLSKFIVCEFNNSTGQVFNRTDIVSTIGNLYGATYGVEFSPDGKLLYGTTIMTPKILQFNLALHDGASIGDSAFIIDTHPPGPPYNYYYGALQLGPDGKIYVANCGDSILGVINNPNALSFACNHVNNAVALSGKRSYLGLPNILTSYALPVYDTSVTICSSQTYTLPDGVIVNSPGVYYSHFATANSCDSVVVTQVKMHFIQKPDLGADRVICSGETIELKRKNKNNYEHYLWNDRSRDSILQVSSPKTYWLQVTDSSHCTSSDTIVLTAGYCNEPIIPNAFSPNGDGINDTWNIEHLKDFPNCHVSVFNRYGAKVFESTGYDRPWDGMYSIDGKRPVGTYYYLMIIPGYKTYSRWLQVIR